MKKLVWLLVLLLATALPGFADTIYSGMSGNGSAMLTIDRAKVGGNYLWSFTLENRLTPAKSFNYFKVGLLYDEGTYSTTSGLISGYSANKLTAAGSPIAWQSVIASEYADYASWDFGSDPLIGGQKAVFSFNTTLAGFATTDEDGIDVMDLATGSRIATWEGVPSPTAVPEPTSIAALATLMPLGFVLRRKQK